MHDIDMRNRQFELISNASGHAHQSTLMAFDNSSHPFRATYSGPNVAFGHVIVNGNQMLYHSLDSAGKLSAGTANVTFNGSVMVLHWQWLTGDRSGGESHWQEINI